ncbi:MAG: ATP-binding cassette domain-containing protein, partial [Brevinema sp.]
MLATMKNITKKIFDGSFERILLEDISLTFELNEIIALVGTSGAGKSALLRILSGLEVINNGEYHFNNTLVTNMPESALANLRRKNMGFIGFEPEFLQNMTVEECLSMPLNGLSISHKDQKNLIIDALEII